MTRTEMARVSEGSGAGKLSGRAADDGGDTWVVTSKAADKAVAGGRHGTEPGERDRVAGQNENPAGKSSGVEGSEGRREASGVAKKSRGDRQGVGVRF